MQNRLSHMLCNIILPYTVCSGIYKHIHCHRSQARVYVGVCLYIYTYMLFSVANHQPFISLYCFLTWHAVDHVTLLFNNGHILWAYEGALSLGGPFVEKMHVEGG